MERPDDAELWREARAGGGRSFAALFRLHRDAVLRQSLRFVADPADAEEIAAAAFFELWRHRDRVRIVDGSVLPWLLVTSGNLARNGVRAARRREALLDRLLATHDRASVSPVGETDDGVDRSSLVAALRRLSPADAVLLTMVALEGYKPGEAAAVLGISDRAARTRLHRARSRLRPLLRDHPDPTGHARGARIMSRPTMSSGFSSQVERALELLPTAPASRSAGSPPPLRSIVVTAVVAAVVVVAAILAIGLAPHRTAPAAPTSTPVAPTVASCTNDRVRPFTCDTFILKAASGAFVEFEAWFDVLDGRPRFVVGESERLRILPVALTANGATAAPAPGWPQLQRGCSPDSECELDRAVERVFTGGARISVDGERLRLSAGSTTLTGTSTGRPHRYAQLGVAEAGDHVLLTYHDNGMHMTALAGGRLGYNAAGCLTNGSSVIVLPDTTVLHADGSIDVAGERIPVGGRLNLGGGQGGVPADQRCGTGAYFYGYGT